MIRLKHKATQDFFTRLVTDTFKMSDKISSETEMEGRDVCRKLLLLTALKTDGARQRFWPEWKVPASSGQLRCLEFHKRPFSGAARDETNAVSYKPVSKSSWSERGLCVRGFHVSVFVNISWPELGSLPWCESVSLCKAMFLTPLYIKCP